MSTDSSGADGQETADASSYQVSPSEAPSEAVVRAVAAHSGQRATALEGGEDATSLDPLYGVVDPDALDALCGRPNDGPTVTVQFAYSGYDVTVESTGRITVTER